MLIKWIYIQSVDNNRSSWRRGSEKMGCCSGDVRLWNNKSRQTSQVFVASKSEADHHSAHGQKLLWNVGRDSQLEIDLVVKSSLSEFLNHKSSSRAKISFYDFIFSWFQFSLLFYFGTPRFYLIFFRTKPDRANIKKREKRFSSS